MAAELDPHRQAWQAHYDSCEICRDAASFRTACDEGKRLHEEWVVAAHAEREAGREPGP